MTDNSGKTGMAIGETDDPDALIQTYAAGAAVTKGDPVYLSACRNCNKCCCCSRLHWHRNKDSSNCWRSCSCSYSKDGSRSLQVALSLLAKLSTVLDASKRVLMLADVSQAVDEGGAAKYTVAVPFAQKLGEALQATTTAGDLLFIKVG